MEREKFGSNLIFINGKMDRYKHKTILEQNPQTSVDKLEPNYYFSYVPSVGIPM